MNILLIGGSGNFINDLIIKLNKEGHRIYLLTGSRYKQAPYQKVFERYDFTYDCTCLDEIFESINPDLTIFLGAHDTNFKWQQEKEGVRFSASLMNILMSYTMSNSGRFIYLSSGEVYGADYETFIPEDSPKTPAGMKGMVLSQAEEICESFRTSRGLDILTLRLDHFYSIPKVIKDIDNLCAMMCLEALEKNTITITENNWNAYLYVTDAVEYVYRFVTNKEYAHAVYNLSSAVAVSDREIAEIIVREMGEDIQLVVSERPGVRNVLSNERMAQELGAPMCCDVAAIVRKMANQMKKNSNIFLRGDEAKLPFWKRVLNKANWFIKAMIPFAENLILFIPVFMINNRTTESTYFANLDIYLLYVLLFAIVYGQQQAVFSAVLATVGYCFRQMYDKTGFEVMLDANTYIWIAQLFILGLSIGYMKDKLNVLKRENEDEQEFLSVQLHDIQDINSSNIRVKDALETQIVNQSDSIGKIYSITSTLDQYSSEEVLFYATEMLGKLFGSRDVAIYTISNDVYARLFSSTSEKASSLGHSIRYSEMGEFYEVLKSRKVFINRNLDESLPLMANAIFEEDKMQMIICIWGIPWERMTLGQANQLTVISSLIQNAVLRANRYLKALEKERFVEGSKLMETSAFSALANAFMAAEHKGLTDSTLIRIKTISQDYVTICTILGEKLRDSDYMGTLEDGGLYVLLCNTNTADTAHVINRFAQQGVEAEIVEDML